MKFRGTAHIWHARSDGSIWAQCFGENEPYDIGHENEDVGNFVEDLQKAHERGEVVVISDQTKASVRAGAPLTAEAIGEAVAKAIRPLVTWSSSATKKPLGHFVPEEELKALRETAEAARELVARLEGEVSRDLPPMKCARMKAALRHLESAQESA